MESNKERFDRLINQCQDIVAFKYEDRIFLGNCLIAANQFIKDNPQSADFYVWLQDNYKELK